MYLITKKATCTVHLIMLLYNYFIHNFKGVCFTSVHVNFIDLIVFVEQGTVLHNLVCMHDALTIGLTEIQT